MFKKFYVDNFLISVFTKKYGNKLAENFRYLLSMGSFNLKKWISNCDKVMETIPKPDKSKVFVNDMLSVGPCKSVLDVSWQASDVFLQG